jgi:hypothetical protein
MYGYTGHFKAFAERELRDYLEENNQKIQSRIGQESENYILNVNELEYINYLNSEFTIDTLKIDFGSASVTSCEKQIPSKQFPTHFYVRQGESYPKQVVVYHLPYAGNSDLLRYTPTTRLLWTTEIFIEDQSVCFEIINFSGHAEDIKRDAQQIINDLKTQLGHLTHEIDGYNARLPNNIEQNFKKRKQQFLDNNNLLGSLGVPIKKREGLPQTYAIPTPQIRKSINAKPNVLARGYKPEPTLNQSVYHDILQTIYDVGKVFERYPSTYSGKGEEDLRNHLLLYLEPRFEGSTTGETFNKVGKTDILIRYENSNVFIAECKFWQGSKNYLATITQLLGYLTWRDSKAAVVVFVSNKDFSSVLKAVEEATSTHPNYLGYVNKEDESWFNYRFHINDDSNREVKVAVLLFHIPSL